MAAGRRRLHAETLAAWDVLSPQLPALSRATSLQDLDSDTAAICSFADCARHFLLLNKDDPVTAALAATICCSEQHAEGLLTATRQALLLLAGNADQPLQLPQQGVWLCQRLCEAVTDVFYVFWSRLQQQGANSSSSSEDVWLEADKVHSKHTRMLIRMTVQSRILSCLSGACKLVDDMLTDQPPAETLDKLKGQQHASYAALTTLAEALIALWRALARFWPECQLLVDHQLTPMRDNPMARSVPAILRLCNAVLSNWPGPAPLQRSRDPAAILSTRLQDRVQAPKLKPAEVYESLRGSAVEALAVADKLVFVLYNEVLIRPGGVDVTQDPDLKECLTSTDMQEVMLAALATFCAVRHSKLKGVSPCTPPVPNPGAAAAAAAAGLAGGAGSNAGSSAGSSSSSRSAKAGKKGSSSSSSSSSGKAKQKGLSIPPLHTLYFNLTSLTGIEARAVRMATEQNTAVVFTGVLAYLFTARFQSIKAAREAGFWEAGAVAVMPGTTNDLPRVNLASVLLLVVEHVMLAPELEHLWSGLQLMLHVAQPCFTCPHILPVSSTRTGGGHHAAFTDAAAEDDFHNLVHMQLYPALLETLAPGLLWVLKESEALPKPSFVPPMGWAAARQGVMKRFAQLLLATHHPGDFYLAGPHGRPWLEDAALLCCRDPLLWSAVYDCVLRAVADDPAIAQAVLSPAYVQAHDGVIDMTGTDLDSRLTAGTRRPVVKAGSYAALTQSQQGRMWSWLLPFEGQQGAPEPLLNLAARLVTVLVMGVSFQIDEGSLLPAAVRTHSDRGVRAKHLFSVLLTCVKVLAQHTRLPASSSRRLWAMDQVWALQQVAVALLERCTMPPSAAAAAAGSKKKKQARQGGPSSSSSSSSSSGGAAQHQQQQRQEQQLWLLLLGRIAVVYSDALQSSIDELSKSSSSSGNSSNNNQTFVELLYTDHFASLLKALEQRLEQRLEQQQQQQQQQQQMLPAGDDPEDLVPPGFSHMCQQMTLQVQLTLQRQQERQGLLPLVPGWLVVSSGIRTIGQLLCSSLTTEVACNNPDCRGFVGLSEMQGVSGKGRACGNCRVARYCSKDCQSQEWAFHKPVCKRLAATVGGGAGSSSSSSSSKKR